MQLSSQHNTTFFHNWNNFSNSFYIWATILQQFFQKNLCSFACSVWVPLVAKAIDLANPKYGPDLYWAMPKNLYNNCLLDRIDELVLFQLLLSSCLSFFKRVQLSSSLLPPPPAIRHIISFITLYHNGKQNTGYGRLETWLQDSILIWHTWNKWKSKPGSVRLYLVSLFSRTVRTGTTTQM